MLRDRGAVELQRQQLEPYRSLRPSHSLQCSKRSKEPRTSLCRCCAEKVVTAGAVSVAAGSPTLDVLLSISGLRVTIVSDDWGSSTMTSFVTRSSHLWLFFVERAFRRTME
jgi:hypothetical protein